MEKTMRTAMAFGSFDPLHEGHRALFAQAKRHGDRLIVVISRDASIRRIKHREPHLPEEARRKAVAREPTVDEATLGDADDFLKVVVEKRPDILVLGYDQATFPEEELTAKLAARGLRPRIVRAAPFEPQTYKSSKYRQ